MPNQNDLVLLNQLLDQQSAVQGAGMDASEFFEIFTALQVLKDEDLSYEEIEQGITDKGGDGGIDSFYFFVNGTLYAEDLDLATFKKNVELCVVIIQSKTSAGFSEAGMDRLASATSDLFDLNANIGNLRRVYHKSLLQKVGEFRKAFLGLTNRFPKVTFRYAYAAKAVEVHPNVARKIDQIKAALQALISPVSFSFDFLDAARLLALARREPSATYQLTLAETPISPGTEGFICLVALKDYLAFIRDEDGRLRHNLFEGNVRDYQGNTEVNREIRRTLENPPGEDFWLLNNGLSILCSNASLSGKVLTIEDPEIVNGLQTSREVFDVLTKTDVSRESRSILVRVLKPRDESSRDRIIKATNSQTSIPPASLRATDKIHRDIEQFLAPKGLFYDRRKNFYKNSGKPAQKIVGIPLMAQAVIACALLEPANARARPSTLIKDDAAYARIFNPEYDLNLYFKCICIVQRVQAFLKGTGVPELKEDANNLRFYIAALATLRVSGVPRPSVAAVANLDVSLFTDDMLSAAAQDVFAEYTRLGGSDQVAKGPDLERVVLAKHADAVTAQLRGGAGRPRARRGGTR